MYYDSNFKQIKFYLDGVEQVIPYLDYKYNVLNGNYLRGKDLLLGSILTLGIVANLIIINDIVDTYAYDRNIISPTMVVTESTEENEFSTCKVVILGEPRFL